MHLHKYWSRFIHFTGTKTNSTLIKQKYNVLVKFFTCKDNMWQCFIIIGLFLSFQTVSSYFQSKNLLNFGFRYS